MTQSEQWRSYQTYTRLMRGFTPDKYGLSVILIFITTLVPTVNKIYKN